jgi:hypothetical protein
MTRKVFQDAGTSGKGAFLPFAGLNNPVDSTGMREYLLA